LLTKTFRKSKVKVFSKKYFTHKVSKSKSKVKLDLYSINTAVTSYGQRGAWPGLAPGPPSEIFENLSVGLKG
jgi:hypothetical protein